jgi:hypothetical protein
MRKEFYSLCSTIHSLFYSTSHTMTALTKFLINWVKFMFERQSCQITKLITCPPLEWIELCNQYLYKAFPFVLRHREPSSLPSLVHGSFIRLQSPWTEVRLYSFSISYHWQQFLGRNNGPLFLDTTPTETTSATINLLFPVFVAAATCLRNFH